ncbi:DUF2786 domain-containing protein [Amycolatopsis vancoresmycina]|uniref:DUF2786 domain-containing protein n=1 Tax=Amycolatopsis vancoresmycina DSM 44592 TaxID=1292037 RepID=R1I082_9PSEU|nr:DUF2786 domain-containing protein [Amycolatopsis vancoresmycina]EOD65931.1 hypothetical protein H480_24102 [Amycolatopsis vancoresmycina DSM 44592]
MTTISPPITATWLRCHDTARAEGMGPALAVLHAALPAGAPVFGTGGVAVLPAGPVDGDVLRALLAKAESSSFPEEAEALSAKAQELMTRHALDRVLVTAGPELPGGTVVLARTGRAAGPTGPVLAIGSVWLRLGLSGALLDAALDYLGGRQSGDTTLLRRQLVQGAVAEALTGQLQVRAALTADTPAPAALSYLHTRLTETDRVLLRLLGAAGFARGGAGEVADVSELLAGAYTPEAAA